MKTKRLPLLAIFFGVLLAPSVKAGSPGTTVAGSDLAILAPQQVLRWEPYENANYRLTRDGNRARVEVWVDSLLGQSPWRLAPTTGSQDPLERTSRTVASGAQSLHEAVSRILGWIAREIRYSLDRGAPQDPVSVLERRSGYCTGIARLAVAMLRAVGISAREVAGFVFEEGEGGGFHRWIEVFYPGVGWAFSDPRLSVGFVPATYLRLSAEELWGNEIPGGLVLLRRDGVRPVDIAWESGGAPLRIGLTRSSGRQRAALRIVGGVQVGRGVAVLMGRDRVRQLTLDAEGNATFLDLLPGEYLLKVEGSDGKRVWKRVTFREPVYAELELVGLTSAEESP